jgi:hypothetical protein
MLNSETTICRMYYHNYELCIELWHTNMSDHEIIVHYKQVYRHNDVIVGRRKVPLYILSEFDKFFQVCHWIYCDSLD